MNKHIAAAITRIDKLNPRDRMALAGGIVAAMVGIEMMIVMPMKTKRVAIEQAVLAESASQSEAQQAAVTERVSRLADLRKRGDEVDAKLASLGLKSTQRDSLSTFLARALQDQGVKLTSLRGMPIEHVTIAPTDASADVTPPVSADAAAGKATPNLLFRHRAELKLEGPLPGVLRAVDMLERELAPLRIERVLLGSTSSAGAARALVVLTTISQERTWLVL
jgi:type II secretory pathway component PulM